MSFDTLFNWNDMPDLLEKYLPIWLNEKTVDKPSVANLNNEERERLKNLSFQDQGKDPNEILDIMSNDVYKKLWKIDHPRNMAFVPSPVSPLSSIVEICNSIFNPYAAGYENSEGTNILENKTIRFLAGALGYDEEQAGGFSTSGGSMANFSAFILARDQKLKQEDFAKARIYATDQAHSSIAKAARLLGFLPQQITKVDTDDDFKMIPADLRHKILADKENGFCPFLIVATAGTTNTGVVDPLSEIADIRDEFNLWLHVDGAYGGSAALSSYRSILSGIERTDSVTWDAHKWLFQTLSCSFLIVRDGKLLHNSFHSSAEYLEAVEDDNATFAETNGWDISIEMTRPARTMKLWFTFQVAGMETIQKALDHGFESIVYLAKLFENKKDWRIVSEPHMSTLNVRFEPEGWSKEMTDAAQVYLCDENLKTGFATYITTKLLGDKVIRFCAPHPDLTKADLEKITTDLFERGAELKVNPDIISNQEDL